MTTKCANALKPGDVILRGETWSADVDHVEQFGDRVRVTHTFGVDTFAADRIVRTESR